MYTGNSGKILALFVAKTCHMKKHLFLLLLVTLSGCATYQYVAIDSDLPQNNYGEMLIENDTVLIKYKFSGPNCPAVVHIFNKMDVPLYIDWKQSSFILSGKSIGHSDEKLLIAGQTVGAETALTPQTSFAFSNMTGTITNSSAHSFIPPRSYIEGLPVNLRTTFFDTRGFEIARRPGVAPQPYKFFDREDSPFKFRNYLTLSTFPDMRRTFSYDNEFWAQSIRKSGSRPASQPLKRTQNQFYLSKPTGVGAVIGFLVLISLIGVGVSWY
jgi:hypothetical protein